MVAGFVDEAYQAGAATKANGDYALASYPCDLANKSSATPEFVKTSLLEVARAQHYMPCTE